MSKEVVIFKNGELELEVTVSENRENVWLSQDQMATLFDVDRSRVTRHIKNIYDDNELDENSTCAENALVQTEGKRKVKRTIKIYNLDMILAVGYRVKSPNGIIFRKWATSILKDYMIKGYTINQKRLDALHKTVEIQTRILASTLELEEKEVLNVIETYANALSLLDDYDHGLLSKPEGTNSIYRLSYQECRELIDKMKFDSDVFGIEKEEKELNINNNKTEKFLLTKENKQQDNYKIEILLNKKISEDILQNVEIKVYSEQKNKKEVKE